MKGAALISERKTEDVTRKSIKKIFASSQIEWQAEEMHCTS